MRSLRTNGEIRGGELLDCGIGGGVGGGLVGSKCLDSTSGGGVSGRRLPWDSSDGG